MWHVLDERDSKKLGLAWNPVSMREIAWNRSGGASGVEDGQVLYANTTASLLLSTEQHRNRPSRCSTLTCAKLPIPPNKVWILPMLWPYQVWTAGGRSCVRARVRARVRICVRVSRLAKKLFFFLKSTAFTAMLCFCLARGAWTACSPPGTLKEALFV